MHPCPRLVRLITLAVVVTGCDADPPGEARPARAEHESAPARAAATEPSRVDEPTAAAVATPPSPSPDRLAPEPRRRYQAAIDEGRRRHRRGDYRGAMVSFSRALDVLPGDPRALSELGWAALFAEQLDEAEEALRQAEAAATEEGELLASILYNQGRVAEVRGDTERAIDAYRRSLRLRAHPAAYRRLVGLEGGTRYEFGPTVRALQGPYARLEELCDEERRLSVREREGDEPSFVCFDDARQGLAGAAVELPDGKLPPPWTRVRFVEVRPSAFAVRFHAALRTDDGWYVLPEVASLSRGEADTDEQIVRLAATTETFPGLPRPGVVFEVETRWTETAAGREIASEANRVEFLCGLGSSDVPSCTGALPRATEAAQHGVEGSEHTQWSVQRRWSRDGVLVLEGDSESLDEPAAALLGEHAVGFP